MRHARIWLLTGLPALALPFLLSPIHTIKADESFELPPFRNSSTCATCHDNSSLATAMRDEKGKPIAPFDLWQSTMMANSARDPFWRAAVAREVENTPSQRQAIEAKCMGCHTPMANPVHGDTDYRLGMDLLTQVSDRATAALDGVSCTVCHAIMKDNLGTPASYDGRFKVSENKEMFGPHGTLFSMPMSRFTGLNPTQSGHVLESKLCGSCHTLETHTLAADGKPTGSVHQEQSPYREWRNSVFTTEVASPGPKAASCQDCHVPKTSEAGKKISTKIAHNPSGRDWNIASRSPYGRHLFVGGNTLIPSILRDNPSLNAKASKAAFDATIAAVKDQLSKRTATVQIQKGALANGKLSFEVLVKNLVGHKFPSAYPSRRSWLRIRVLDKNQNKVFDSGSWNAEGFILDSNGKVRSQDLVGGAVEAHHDKITNSDQVQIYQAVMKDDAGKPTWLLMRAAGYAKDNRLLPEGWSPTHAEAAKTAPAGIGTDPDYKGGSDILHVEFAAAEASKPYQVTVDFVYQTHGGRYLSEFLTAKAPAVKTFEALWKKADRRPQPVATHSVTIK